MRSLCFLLLSASLCLAQSGRWEGELKNSSITVACVVELERSPSGEWYGAMSIPSTKLIDMPLSGIKVDGVSVQFVLPGPPGDPAFKGAVSADGATLTGMMKQGDGELPLAAKRTGPAKLAAPEKSTPVSDDLLGEWNGRITTSTTILDVVVHISRASDGSGVLKLETPELNGKELQVNVVRQTGSKFSFESKLYGLRYAGEINAGHSEIEGKLSQVEIEAPLVLKKVN